MQLPSFIPIVGFGLLTFIDGPRITDFEQGSSNAYLICLFAHLSELSRQMVIASVITKVLKTTDSDQPAHLPLVLNAASDSESWLFLIVLVTMAYLTKQSYYDLKTMGYFP